MVSNPRLALAEMVDLPLTMVKNIELHTGIQVSRLPSKPVTILNLKESV